MDYVPELKFIYVFRLKVIALPSCNTYYDLIKKFHSKYVWFKSVRQIIVNMLIIIT